MAGDMRIAFKGLMLTVAVAFLASACGSSNDTLSDSYDRDLNQFRTTDFQAVYDLKIDGLKVGDVTMTHAEGISDFVIAGLSQPIDGMRISWHLESGTQTVCVADVCESAPPMDDAKGYLGMAGATHEGVEVQSRTEHADSSCYELSLSDEPGEVWEECYGPTTLTRATGLGARLFLILLDTNLPPNASSSAFQELRDNALLELELQHGSAPGVTSAASPPSFVSHP